MVIKTILKKIVPSKLVPILYSLYKPFGRFLFKYELKKIRKKQHELVQVLKLQQKIKVIFLVIHESVWKYEEVYNLLNKDPKFDVEVVVIPLVRNNEGQMDVYQQTLHYFKQNNYRTKGAYDELNKTWLDIKELTKPDVVFFTNPHKLTFDQYYITNFRDKLTCYSPYAFVVIHSISMHYGQDFHQYLWKYFLETEHHNKFLESFQIIRKSNSIVTGFPGLDVIYNKSFKPNNPWKKCSTKTYKIIWAPHHTINGQGSDLDYSSFSSYCFYFINLIKTNKNIQLAFKPHPLLKEKLYKDEEWGKEKTDRYYNQWNEIDNGQLEESSYIDLFYFSDAMILDCASFIVEYLYFDKPILFTKIDDNVIDRFNTFGQNVFNYMYQSSNTEELENFIFETVMKENDALRISRNEFLKKVVLPKNGKTASENIYNELKNRLC